MHEHRIAAGLEQIQDRGTASLPLVSVIIPTYNRAAVLERSVRSALSQTLENIEVIVVDDGSSDDTDRVISSIRDFRLRYLRHTQNRGGPAAARNRGVKSARSSLVAFLDSDDLTRPSWLECLRACFLENPNLGLAWAAKRKIAPEGNVVGVQFWDFGKKADRSGLLPKMLMWTPGTGGLMVRTAVLETIGHFDERLTAQEDRDFTLRFAVSQAWDAASVRRVLYDWHMSSASNSQTYDGAYVQSFKYFIDKHSRVLSEHPDALAFYLFLLSQVLLGSGRVDEGRYYLEKSIVVHPGYAVRARLFKWLHGHGLEAWYWRMAGARRAVDRIWKGSICGVREPQRT